jgi:histidyl-tRNA synthetase
VARAFIENGMAQWPLPVKLQYDTPCFRCENTQAGRYRQFHQFGCELFGSSLPEADFELIAVADLFFKKVEVRDTLTLYLNSIGCADCRGKYLDALKKYYQTYTGTLCGQCKVRLEKNTLRVLDCKEETCIELNKKAPVITDYLCGGCAGHFNKLQQLLKTAEIKFEVDPRIVRGLDYYTGTVFEFVTGAIGAQSTVCGGGRYDKLIEELGGKSTPAAGFGIGIERLLLLIENSGAFPSPQKDGVNVYFAVMGEEARTAAFAFMKEMREKEGISTETDLSDRTLKAQLKYAADTRVMFTVILGEEELKTKKATLKDMATGNQKSVDFKKLTKYLGKRTIERTIELWRTK